MFLAYLIKEHGIQSLPEKVVDIVNLEPLKTFEVRRGLLGIINFYRKSLRTL